MEGPAPAPTAPTGQAPTAGTTTTTPERPKLKRSTRIALTVILIVALIAGGVFATSYFLNARNYVSTDNAQIEGDKIQVNSPAPGILEDWRVTLGTELSEGQVIGRIKIQTGFSNALMNIRAPADGTVAVDNGVPGAYVNSGIELATAYDLDKVYVIARVEETDVKPVRLGQQVDIDVDAFPNTPLTGYVSEIQGGAATQFSLYPQANTSGNYQKVTQVIPVKILLDDRRGLELVPGMSVVVDIHKR